MDALGVAKRKLNWVQTDQYIVNFFLQGPAALQPNWRIKPQYGTICISSDFALIPTGLYRQ